MSFVHLHSHLTGSLSDSILDTEEVLEWAARHRAPAHAVTDHGALTALYPFLLQTADAKLKPLLGCEFYFDARLDRDNAGPAANPPLRTHLVLLARDLTGFRNLVRLNNLAWRKNFLPPRYPLVDWSMLERFSRGLICTTACIGGPIATHLRADRCHAAERTFQRLREIFGERLYLEFSGHPLKEQPAVNRALAALGQRTGARCILTNDCHYARPEDWFVHNVYIKTREKIPSRFAYSAACFDLKSPEEMRALGFPERYSAETLALASTCNAAGPLRARIAKGLPPGGKDRSLPPMKRVPITPYTAVADVCRVHGIPPELFEPVARKALEAASLPDAARRFKIVRSFSRRHTELWRAALRLEGMTRYVEPDFDHRVEVSAALLSYLPIRRIGRDIVLDLDTKTMRALGVPVRKSRPGERRELAASEHFHNGLRAWWHDDFETAVRCFEKAVAGEAPAEWSIKLADCLAALGKRAAARNVLYDAVEHLAPDEAVFASALRKRIEGLEESHTKSTGGRARAKEFRAEVLPLPDVALLSLKGRMRLEDVPKVTRMVERFLEDDVAALAVETDAAVRNSPLFIPLLTGLHTFYHRIGGVIVRIERRRSEPVTPWCPRFTSVSEFTKDYYGGRREEYPLAPRMDHRRTARLQDLDLEIRTTSCLPGGAAAVREGRLVAADGSSVTIRSPKPYGYGNMVIIAPTRGPEFCLVGMVERRAGTRNTIRLNALTPKYQRRYRNWLRRRSGDQFR